MGMLTDCIYIAGYCLFVLLLFLRLYIQELILITTLTGVTQLKIGDVCWRASEVSETVLGVDNAKSGICYMYVCMYGLYVCPLNARAGKFFSKKTRLFRLDSSLF